MRTAFVAGLVSLGLAAAAAAQDHTRVPLWPNGAPGSEARRQEAEVARDYWVKNVHDPSLTVYLPEPAKATGAAVVVVPGGGHRELVFKAKGRSPPSSWPAWVSPRSPSSTGSPARRARRTRSSARRARTSTVRSGSCAAVPPSGMSTRLASG